MVSLTTKRRGGPRAALAVDAAKVNVRRPKVKVKCIDKAFKCKAGSRFGILKQRLGFVNAMCLRSQENMDKVMLEFK